MKFVLVRSRLAILSFLLLSSLACRLSLLEWPDWTASTPLPPTPSLPTPTPHPLAQVNVRVKLAAPLPSGETLALRLLDEVTGLPYHYTDIPLNWQDSLTYTATLSLPLQSVVRYRYVRLGPAVHEETDVFHRPIRYRLYHVRGPAEIEDTIAAWPDQPYQGPTGSIQGVALSAENGAPIPNLLIAAAGMHTLTDSAGRFFLPGLPPGTHLVIGYALDGGYSTFQQGAAVAEGLITPVEMRLQPAVLVPVVFTVHVPANTIPGAPLYLAGNLLQLGNSFADLRGNMSGVANRLPRLTPVTDRIYTLTLSLPAGADIRYKYTLGDGYWNAERQADGTFHTRQVILPPNGATLEDIVDSWQGGYGAPITFEVTVPPETPAGDVVYIQFAAPGWSEPIPMWAVGNHVWRYQLYGPFPTRLLEYRYCRNAQCGVADDVTTAGTPQTARQIGVTLVPQDLRDTVTRWAAWEAGTSTLVGSNVIPRNAGFWAGVEFLAAFHPTWTAFTPQAMQNLQAIGANWVVLTPTWTYHLIQPLDFGIRPGHDPLWSDMTTLLAQGKAAGLNVALFPQPRFLGAAADFWQTAPRTPLWWQTWFDAYHRFAIHHADLATQSGAQALILGGDWLGPALPNGRLPDGRPSGVPDDAEIRWLAILNDVRVHFRGPILWALPYTPPDLILPSFLSQTDGVYLLISGHLSDAPQPTKDDLAAAAAAILDNTVQPLQSLLGQPVYLAFAYPSVNGGGATCLPARSPTCLDWTALTPPADLPELSRNLQLQADIYESLLAAVNTRPWVSGVISRGYYPPALLRDKSASVHGKPAADVLWYWYRRFLNAQP